MQVNEESKRKDKVWSLKRPWIRKFILSSWQESLSMVKQIIVQKFYLCSHKQRFSTDVKQIL